MDAKETRLLMMEYLLMFNHPMTRDHKWRTAGALEALLYVVGKLEHGKAWPYIVEERHADGLFGIGAGPYTLTESHIAMCKRLATEYLRETHEQPTT
jgi:hypothetical protein